MSRSIHTTRRTLRELGKKKFPSAEAKTETYKETFGELRRKRLIKNQVARERKNHEAPLQGMAVETIPIHVREGGKFVHHAASEDDIMAVLRLLPSAAVEGITRIHLTLGKDVMERFDEDPSPRVDPFTRRPSGEILPGVYGGVVLGTYRPKGGVISLFAYVYDVKQLGLPLPICEVYLRMHALKTFVHEVAHHHDHTERVRRGRWLSDRKENAEWYAEKMEHQWTQDIVVPYLERTYKKEVQMLRKWVAHRGGILLPLQFFAGDGRRTERDGLQRLFLSSSSAFQGWVAGVCRCANLTESRIAFAWDLHYADLYDECLEVVDQILLRESDNVPAIICKADTLVHLENFDEALLLADKVLGITPSNTDVRKTRGDVLEHRCDWIGLLDNCDLWQRVGKLTLRSKRQLHLHRAIAYCALEENAAMEASIEDYLAAIRFRTDEGKERRLVFARKLIYRRAGKEAPAQIARLETLAT